ncbi:IS5 family transposase [Bradyrhizobium elkanii]|nr:IS5 family transposase [Bradyrhizobium elkanii]MCS3521065.1 IS5 family transposase [Bradyrhizobium elkanii]MCS4068720.1 IS5 family transposase [Bradyrhizobium elkanii]MCS4084254.1 IS5 family transposase [Bradyrhizobium elkanii]
MHNLSDEVLCARWIENPYYQYFCGELSFCHRLPLDRSSMTRWRQRLGEEQLVALIQESLSVAHKTGAIGPKDLERVVVNTTVQPKAVAHPTDARLMHRAITKLVGLAKRNRVPLRQSYPRPAKRRHHGRRLYPRSSVQARPAPTQVPADAAWPDHPRHLRKIDGDAALEARFGPLLDLAQRVRSQDQHQRGHKVYALHAPAVECIGKGKARAPYEFGCKVSIATPVTSPKAGQFVLHTKALHGNPFDGRTLGPVVADMETLTGVEALRQIKTGRGDPLCRLAPCHLRTLPHRRPH